MLAKTPLAKAIGWKPPEPGHCGMGSPPTTTTIQITRQVRNRIDDLREQWRKRAASFGCRSAANGLVVAMGLELLGKIKDLTRLDLLRGAAMRRAES